jgi:hypothetical protein
LRFTGGGDPLLKGAPFAGRPINKYTVLQ